MAQKFFFFHSSFHPFKGPTSTWFGGHCWGQLEHGKQHCASDEPPYQAEWYGPGGADQRGPLNQQQYVKQQPDPAVEQQQQFDQQQHQQATWWNTDWAPCTGSFCINMCFRWSKIEFAFSHLLQLCLLVCFDQNLLQMKGK